MVWKQYVPVKPRYNCNKELTKTIAIVVLIAAVGLLLGALLSLKRAYSMREYSIANNCRWIYQNTAYGDDRDYICK